jgi:predicted HD phosphohydrolase
MTDRLLEAMAHAGARLYGGERVSELAHALQCAERAEAGGADPHLTLACLLHDVGPDPGPAATTRSEPS